MLDWSVPPVSSLQASSAGCWHWLETTRPHPLKIESTVSKLEPAVTASMVPSTGGVKEYQTEWETPALLKSQDSAASQASVVA